MSTGLIIVTVVTAIACVAAFCMMFAAWIHASQTEQRNALGLASDSKREQANRTFAATAVGLLILFLTLLAMPLMVKLGPNLALDPAEETSTPSATSEPADTEN